MTGTLDTFTNLKWQLLGLWIRILTSSTKDRDSRYFYCPLVAIDRDYGSQTMDTFTDLKWK